MGPLVCPSCATEHDLSERFCRDCGTPLVYAPGVTDGGPPLNEARERARKVHAGYRRGPLVTVASARNQAEAELVQNLLLEEGIPSLVRRTGGFDVPDFLASGPRDILVPEAGADAARDLLGPAAFRQRTDRPANTPDWVRALAAVLAVVILVTVAVGVIVALGG
jgi:hypothetical protein